MISVVIPNYNRFDLLENCIKSILQGSLVADEIIIVDNGSSDFKQDVIYDRRVRFIRLQQNMGFSRAVNIGIQQSKGNYIVILNNDTEVDTNWLKNLIHVFEANSKILFATSKIKSLKHKGTFDDVGDVLLASGRVYKLGNKERDRGQHDKQCFVFGASGCASAYRREFFKKVGYFDEDFFAYLEDVDLSFRANLQGNRCIYVPEAIVYHAGSATTGGQYNKFTAFHLAQNTIGLFVKNFPIKILLGSILQILVYLAALQLFFIINGLGGAYFRGIISGLRMIRKMIPKRREIMKMRVMTNDEVRVIFRENKKLYKMSKQRKKNEDRV